MRRMIWQWVVEADDYIGEVALDAALSVMSAAMIVEGVQLLFRH